MAIMHKKPEPEAAKAPELTTVVPAAETAKPAEAVKAAEPAKAPKGKKTEKKAEKKPAKKSAKKAEKTEKKAVKATKLPKAPKTVKVFVEYQGRQVDQAAILDAVKADWTGEAIKTLEVYVKPEDSAVYYVVNGKGTGKVNF